MTTVFKLRLLNGDLNGRELILPEGEFTLGEQGCDVLLPLSDGNIVTLCVNEYQVMIQVAEEVWINGAQHDLHTPLPLLQSIEIAGLVFVLGEQTDILSGIKVTHRARFPLLVWLAIAICVPLSLLFVFLFWLTTQPETLRASIPADVPTQLAERLREPALQGIKGTWLADGSVTLSGHCASSSMMEPLQHFLLRNHIAFRNQLVCDDRLIASVSDLLHQHGYHDIEVRIGDEPGNIVIYGAVQMGDQWLTVQDTLAAVSGLKGWLVVNVHSGQIQQLVERLRAAGLLGFLSMTESNKELAISGVLSSEQQQQLKETLAALSQQQPGFPSVRYQNIPASDRTDQFLPAKVVSYGGNTQSAFVRLANGGRLQQGSVLANGYKVVFIGEQGLTLLKANNLVHIPMDF
ncbi:type III secretion system inner membrane ring subunit SctD [Yersinia pseudotuberculosis]|uniref:type III secretion system inner membrane ring subunit SctD n=1 Tax=Yersinia pseudotuberculosis TaxID=633 RepID=UPI001A9F72D7|nr:type III secretion system inner membrane ring subunit SctD [Yersinia pseudotuberculosis]MBO1552202.1 EscD/YscD/HrpQ family type III secretion system inner membrane ring protein [Yersinia pseudotuberculosis]MBO1572421.1 EscD/YscD/HrpQ family type III secretion system inner membrane ring protein [Yersinia pseudotuberculosis]MBO1587276.1 EscD/YscD/HrpQ family type III secretion system inner membrane ring protein [Yersinia pseudotuberculosis]MBO1636814.1 EscD/YscD/HrpQ family type III secretion 